MARITWRKLSAVELDGTQAWILTKDVDEIRETALQRSVRLIPAFDQYVIGASRRAEHLMTGGARNLIYRPQGWISPVLLVNGFIQGVWRHEVKGNRVVVTISSFTRAPKWVRTGAADEAERLAEFLNCKLNVDWKN